MSGVRSDDQVLLGTWCELSLSKKVDALVKENPNRWPTKSRFIRDAIADLLRANGVEVPPELTLAPDRIGKGGPTRYKLARLATHSLNETAPNTPESVPKKMLGKLKKKAK